MSGSKFVQPACFFLYLFFCCFQALHSLQNFFCKGGQVRITDYQVGKNLGMLFHILMTYSPTQSIGVSKTTLADLCGFADTRSDVLAL